MSSRQDKRKRSGWAVTIAYLLGTPIGGAAIHLCCAPVAAAASAGQDASCHEPVPAPTEQAAIDGLRFAAQDSQQAVPMDHVGIRGLVDGPAKFSANVDLPTASQRMLVVQDARRLVSMAPDRAPPDGRQLYLIKDTFLL